METRLQDITTANIERLQLKRLQSIVHTTYSQVPFYRQRFQEKGLRPEHIQSLDDIKHLPFTTKDDLRMQYPYGFFAVSLKEIVRLHASSGTTGKPVVVGYTARDLDIWAQLVARICKWAGVAADDVAQISFGYGLFTGGFGLHHGLEHLGATVVPFSSGNTERQLALMKDFATTVLVCTPSFAIYMAETAEEAGLNPRSFGLRLGLLGGEPCFPSMREEIEKKWGLKATVNYGLTEVIGPGVSGECTAGGGMHISEDHFLPEIIDPKTGEKLPQGEQGELVLTTLTKEGFPVLRYRTRDITCLSTESCTCGNPFTKMEHITGRTDDMLIIKGVNVFPSQIEDALQQIPEVSPHYQLVLTKKKGYIVGMEVQIEISEAHFTDSFRQLEKLEKKIVNHLRSALSLTLRVRLLEPKSLERTTGKTKRIMHMMVAD